MVISHSYVSLPEGNVGAINHQSIWVGEKSVRRGGPQRRRAGPAAEVPTPGAWSRVEDGKVGGWDWDHSVNDLLIFVGFP